MKRIISFVLVCIIMLSVACVTVCAAKGESLILENLSFLRAGGGGGGGGGGGNGGRPHNSSGTSEPKTLGERIIQYLVGLFIFFSSTIVFYLRLTKWSRRSKKLMKEMMKRDTAWKYENISITVTKSYYAIQNAWTNMDMTPAAKYMSDELFEEFQSKLNWMSYKNERNILEDIRLLKVLPVAVHDSDDDSRDYLWVYIKGSMVDYTVNTEYSYENSGSHTASSFVEFWQFTRKDGNWVLNRILQKNEMDQIPFN